MIREVLAEGAGRRNFKVPACVHALKRRQEEQTTLKSVVEFLGLGKPTHGDLTAMGHVKANRGHAENSQYPGCAARHAHHSSRCG